MRYICRVCRDSLNASPPRCPRCRTGVLCVQYCDGCCPCASCKKGIEIKCRAKPGYLPRLGQKIKSMLRNIGNLRYTCCNNCGFDCGYVKHPLPPGTINYGNGCCWQPDCCCPGSCGPCDCCEPCVNPGPCCAPVDPCCPGEPDCCPGAPCQPCCSSPCCANPCSPCCCCKPHLYCKLSLYTVGFLLLLMLALLYYYIKAYYSQCATLRKYRLW